MIENKRPKVSTSKAEQELDRLEDHFVQYDNEIKSLTQDEMNKAPKQELEPQTKIAQSVIADSTDIYLKPEKTIGSQEKFNEKWRKDYEYQKEYVFFTAENNEVKGEHIEIWTKAFPGQNAEFWKVPVNIPVWGPRYLAERIKGCSYHELHMNETVQTEVSHFGTTYGRLVCKQQKQRLDAFPATKKKSIFMGSTTF